jgi:hypothetical protein
VSDIKDGWLEDPAALVGKQEPANDGGEEMGGSHLVDGPPAGTVRRPRGPVRAPRPREAQTSDDGGRTVISRKEHARLLRRQAYQRAKQLRATDPRHLAMKEALKQRRRDAYQAVKAKRKAAAAEQKSAAKAERAKDRTLARKSSSESLMQHVKRGVEAESLPPRRRPPSE